MERLVAHALTAPTPLQELRPDVPPAMAAIVHRLLAKQPEDRFPSARALLEALDSASQGELSTAIPVVEKAGKTGNLFARRQWLFVAAALVVGLGIGLTAYLMDSKNGPAPNGPAPVPLTLEHLQIVFFTNVSAEDVTKRMRDRERVLIKDGQDQMNNLAPWQLKSGDDGFRLEGHFNQPIYWYLAWVDTLGVLEVKSTPVMQAELAYPPEAAKALSPSSKDPPGFNLLLVIAGSVPPEQGVDLLKEHFKGIDKPPAVAWAGTLRGLEEVEVAKDVPRDYLKDLYQRMPPGLEPKYALFFRIDKEPSPAPD
jgi:hypothetical protein